MNWLNIIFTKFIVTAYAADNTIVGKSGESTDLTQSGVNQVFSIIWDKMSGWVAALIIITITIILAKTVTRLTTKALYEHIGEAHESMVILVDRIVFSAIVAVGLLVGLKQAGIDITIIVGSIGFAIGFALKDLLSNFIAGVIILIQGKIHLGSLIKMGSMAGKVESIDARATILKLFDGTQVIIPNSDIFNNSVVIYNNNPTRRVNLPIGVDYRTDLHKATKVISQVLKLNSKILLKPKPMVILESFGDNSINFSVRFWLETKKNWLKIRSEIIESLKVAFDKANISIPWPMRTIVNDIPPKPTIFLKKEKPIPVENQTPVMQNYKTETGIEATELAQNYATITTEEINTPIVNQEENIPPIETIEITSATFTTPNPS